MGKNYSNGAVGYARISIRDQSVFSIHYQKQVIGEYCINNKLNVLAMVSDEGESSYNFDRPNWLSLENFLQEHKGEVRYLIVLDHDRVSSNIADAVKKMEQLEKKAGIKVLSIYEPVSTDTTTSESFLNRAFKLLVANNELLKIRERTKNGIRMAQESGRVVNSAPFGYKNTRDEHGRPLIVADPQRAAIIRQIFMDFIAGQPYESILREARLNGFTLQGNHALTRVLTNPVYAGMIRVSAYGGKPEKLVPAIHEPIISPAVYRKVNEMIGGKPKHKSVPRQEIFLRGLVYCPCGARYTGGYSKGKRKYYLYYRCIREGKPNYPGQLLHALFHETLKKICLTDHMKACIQKSLADRMEEFDRSRTSVIEHDTRELAAIEKQTDQLEECLINGQITPAVYHKWNDKLKGRKSVFNAEIDLLRQQSEAIRRNFFERFTKLSNLDEIFTNCPLTPGQDLIRKVFETGLMYDGQKFSTSYLHPAFAYLRGLPGKRAVGTEKVRLDFEWFSVGSCSGNPTTSSEKLLQAEKELADDIARIMMECIS